MKYLLLLSAFAVLVVGCRGGSGEAILLSNKKFTAVTLPDSPWVDPDTLVELQAENDTNLVQRAVEEPKRITPGTRLSVMVDEDESIDEVFFVKPSGIIKVKYVGAVNVLGLTVEEVEQSIEKSLEEGYFHQATVHVEMSKGGGGTIWILGSVRRQGPIRVPANGHLTVLQAMMAAGGASGFGDTSKIAIIRYAENGKKYKTIFNLDRIKSGYFEDDIPLVAGDWLIVPQKLLSW